MTVTADKAATTTSQDLLDQLVDEGHDGDEVTDAIEVVVMRGLEISDQPDEELLLSAGEVRFIRQKVAGSGTPPTSLPCPAWCNRPAGHGLEQLETGGRWTRDHERVFGDDHLVVVTCLESATSYDGPTLGLSQAEILVSDIDPLSVDKSLELTQALVDATRLLVDLQKVEATRMTALDDATPVDVIPEGVASALNEWSGTVPVYRGYSDPDPFVTDCPPWCRYAPHTFTNHKDDRWHASERCTVPLELEPAELLGSPDGVQEYELETARTSLHQDYRDTAPSIDIGKGDDPGFKLTLDEAESFARAVLALAEVGRKGTNGA